MQERNTRAMTNTEEVPAQASRAEAVAEAGMGADDQPPTAIPSSQKEVDPEKAEDDGRNSPSGSSAGQDVKDEKTVQTPQRSKSKIALIMIALCVRTSRRCFASHTDLLSRLPSSLLRLIL